MSTLTLIDGKLRIDTAGSKALVLSPKPGTDEPCCCGCRQCYCFAAYDNCTTVFLNKKYKQTITVPAEFTLPVTVRAVGVVDDVFMLDGDGTVFGQNPNAFGTGAHNFDYTWTQTNRTFTIEAKDTYGGCTGIAYFLCISPLGTLPTTDCDSVIELPWDSSWPLNEKRPCPPPF